MTLTPERLEEIRSSLRTGYGYSDVGRSIRDLLASHDAQSARIAALETALRNILVNAGVEQQTDDAVADYDVAMDAARTLLGGKS